MSEDAPLLEIRNLERYFTQETGLVRSLLSDDRRRIQAVDDVSFTLDSNESMAVIGESGCGKTTLLFTLMGLHEPTGGEILFKGTPTSSFTKRDWKAYRRNVQVIFQDPFNSLDPKLTVRDTLSEILTIHGVGDRDARIERALERVELSPPEQYLDRFPKQLSGGEKQRVSIARAILLEPEVLLADEPTSMLDVSTQAAVLNTLRRLTDDLDVALVYISHDLSTVSYVAQRINVMYLGRFVESAPTLALLDDAKHPYTEALLQAIPVPDPDHHRERTTMSGAPRDPVDLGDGCRFRDRCPERMDVCDVTPEYREVAADHRVACHLHYDHGADARGTAADTPVDAADSSGGVR